MSVGTSSTFQPVGVTRAHAQAIGSLGCTRPWKLYLYIDSTESRVVQHLSADGHTVISGYGSVLSRVLISGFDLGLTSVLTSAISRLYDGQLSRLYLSCVSCIHRSGMMNRKMHESCREGTLLTIISATVAHCCTHTPRGLNSESFAC